MLNLFRRPIETETLDAWAKWFEDIGKVAALAIPVLIFGDYSLAFKTTNLIALIFSTYSLMLGGKLIRKHKNKLSKEK